MSHEWWQRFIEPVEARMHQHRMDALNHRARRRTEEAEEDVTQKTDSTKRDSHIGKEKVPNFAQKTWKQAFTKFKEKKEIQDSIAFALQIHVKDKKLQKIPRSIDQVIHWNPKEEGRLSDKNTEMKKHHVKLRSPEERHALSVALQKHHEREELHSKESQISVRLTLNVDYLQLGADDKGELMGKIQDILAAHAHVDQAAIAVTFTGFYGSVEVNAEIRRPDAASAELVKKSITSNIAQELVGTVHEIPGVKAAATGELEVTDLEVKEKPKQGCCQLKNDVVIDGAFVKQGSLVWADEDKLESLLHGTQELQRELSISLTLNIDYQQLSTDDKEELMGALREALAEIAAVDEAMVSVAVRKGLRVIKSVKVNSEIRGVDAAWAESIKKSISGNVAQEFLTSVTEKLNNLIPEVTAAATGDLEARHLEVKVPPFELTYQEGPPELDPKEKMIQEAAKPSAMRVDERQQYRVEVNLAWSGVIPNEDDSFEHTSELRFRIEYARTPCREGQLFLRVGQVEDSGAISAKPDRKKAFRLKTMKTSKLGSSKSTSTCGGTHAPSSADAPHSESGKLPTDSTTKSVSVQSNGLSKIRSESVTGAGKFHAHFDDNTDEIPGESETPTGNSLGERRDSGDSSARERRDSGDSSATSASSTGSQWKKGFRRVKHTLKFSQPTESAKVLEDRISHDPEPVFHPIDPLWLSCKSELLYTDDGVATGVARWDEKNGTAIVRLRTSQRLREMRLAGNIHDGLPSGKKIVKKVSPRISIMGDLDFDITPNDRFPVTKLPEARPPRKAKVLRSWEDTEVWATRAQQGASRLALVGSGVHERYQGPSLHLQRSQSATTMRRSKEYSADDHQELQESHRDFMKLIGRPGGQPGPLTGFSCLSNESLSR
eukprot:gnl/MRDRNA2_/MRDRNA2_95135_c0_seq1.p1 gnl/MRDRNA2_/MRDRNA2_95135_c0~~gnl/MRDRNA2_/MRDRNA2_95135_c0_seq1.p1  ORF type:complete len:1041 (+),score=223.87 gnl/MRDRNA2_/MRDRNA2_95135_c0_seq1:454-3123(+)